MPEGAFDIYQTDAGYAAVTNPVQRQILDVLRERERQLPELVGLTGRSKPTLSSLHMKELLARELIAQAVHPTDSRRKIYRLKAQKVGSSDLPVQKLRDAIQHYVSLSPLSARIPIAAAFEAIAAAPPDAAPGTLEAQGNRLGGLVSGLFRVGASRDLWLRLASFLEGEKMAVPLRMDLEAGHLDLRLGPALRGPAARFCPILAGFASGVAEGAGVGLGPVACTTIAQGVRLAWASVSA